MVSLIRLELCHILALENRKCFRGLGVSYYANVSKGSLQERKQKSEKKAQPASPAANATQSNDTKLSHAIHGYYEMIATALGYLRKLISFRRSRAPGGSDVETGQNVVELEEQTLGNGQTN